MRDDRVVTPADQSPQARAGEPFVLTGRPELSARLADLPAGELAWSRRVLPAWGRLVVAAGCSGVERITLVEARDDEPDLSDLAGTARAPRRDDNRLAPFLDALSLFLDAPREQELDLPVASGGSPFRCEVWRRLVAIPCGQVRTYAEVASSLGKPGASRAVGGACGANPVPFVVPCHRVTASDGTLGGFALGAGIKRRLLDAERPSSQRSLAF